MPEETTGNKQPNHKGDLYIGGPYCEKERTLTDREELLANNNKRRYHIGEKYI